MTKSIAASLRAPIITAFSTTLGVPALALTCSTLPLPSDDLGARIDVLGACLTELGEQYKQECQKPLDDLTAATLLAEAERDKDKRLEIEKRAEDTMTKMNANHDRCEEMRHDFNIAMARYNHEIDLSHAEVERIPTT